MKAGACVREPVDLGVRREHPIKGVAQLLRSRDRCVRVPAVSKDKPPAVDVLADMTPPTFPGL